jgi:hypothetical protein
MKVQRSNTIHCVVPIIFSHAERSKVGEETHGEETKGDGPDELGDAYRTHHPVRL